MDDGYVRMAGWIDEWMGESEWVERRMGRYR